MIGSIKKYTFSEMSIVDEIKVVILITHLLRQNKINKVIFNKYSMIINIKWIYLIKKVWYGVIFLLNKILN